MTTLSATVVVERRAKADSYCVEEASQRVRTSAMSNRSVRNRYAFKRIDGRGDRVCSRNDRATMLSAETNVTAEEATSQALSLPSLAALSTTRDKLIAANTEMAPYVDLVSET